MSRLGFDPVLHKLIERICPGARLLDVRAFGIDDAEIAGIATQKTTGYGRPLRLRAELPTGETKEFVFHTVKSDAFGHDRRADRAGQMLLAFDTFSLIPAHVRAMDVGAIRKDGSELTSLAEHGEFYLVTEYEAGRLYADELRTLTTQTEVGSEAQSQAETLARYLANLHQQKLSDPDRYVRSIRDTVGSGEGIFGMLDGFSENIPGAPSELLFEIEGLCLGWRARLKMKHERLARIHGDFHPFNIVFRSDGSLVLLDASRGSVGDAADDLAALSVNYIFFALEHPTRWPKVFRPLWHHFFQTYLNATGDQEVLAVLPLFLAWRGLVVTNPKWYPGLPAVARERVLWFIRNTLLGHSFDVSQADQLFS
ncbi:MAG: phosphotransferase [Polyangiaceae bacterium]|nr:phosphotransferase [Polyangiaceae bacterium]